MVTLRRIGVRSAGRLGFWLGMALSITQLVIFLLILIFLARVPLSELGLDFWLRLLQVVLFSALNSAFTFGMFAYLYNLISRSYGGLELEFEPISPQETKRKNDDNPNVKRPVDIE
jgi:flagellar biosynthesis protein FliQ